MKRILLTGISGTGKSTLTTRLAALGYKAVDADSDDYSEWAACADDSLPGSPVEPNRDWVWRADRIRALLATEDADALFLSGCAANMGQFLPRFDHVVLLSAPAEVIAERLRTRTTNNYGKHPDEAARVLSQLETVEPRLRRVADLALDTSGRIENIVEQLIRLARTDQ